MDDKLTELYQLAITIKMAGESIPEDVVDNMLGDYCFLHEKAKGKDGDLTKFLLGMFFAFGKDSGGLKATLLTMAYLGLEEGVCNDR